jgi:hypothetical protein
VRLTIKSGKLLKLFLQARDIVEKKPMRSQVLSWENGLKYGVIYLPNIDFENKMQ